MNTINQISPEIKTLLPAELPVFGGAPYTLLPFDSRTLDFFNTISRAVLSDKKLNTLPAFAALAFWLRRANMEQIISQNKSLAEPQGFIIEPRGIVFHVCPSNVDTMFVYSLALSLLMGNRNIVKISARLGNESMTLLTSKINNVLLQQEYQLFCHYLSFISYAHDDEISSFYSLNADVRILWGGDQTIGLFRLFPTKPRVKDLVFADRISCALFKTNYFLQLSGEEQKEISRKFFNDSFTFDQLGCSSPQMIFVLGERDENNQFIKSLHHHLVSFAAGLYSRDSYSMASLKLNFLSGSICDGKIEQVELTDNSVVMAEAAEGTGIEKSCGAGFFFVKHITAMDQLIPLIGRKIQTLSYFGLSRDEVATLARMTYGRGIDRIVPVGSALNFDFIWDGYNLVEELCSRKRVI
jgi:hypothetical protein